MSHQNEQRVLLVAAEPAVHSVFRAAAGYRGGASDCDVAALGHPGPGPSDPLQIDVVSQGEEAVERFGEARTLRRPYSVAAVDLDLPGSPDGLETVRRIWELSPTVSVLAFAEGDAERREQLARELPHANRFLLLRKPLEPVDVRQALALVLHYRRLQGEFRSANRSLDEATRALEAARRVTEEAERAKTQFMANISHEIRTPMNAILGFSRLLLREPLTEDQLEKLRYVHDAGNSLLEIVDNTLDFSKLTAGKLKLEQMPFNLDDVIRDVLESARSNARLKGLGLQCHAEEAVPRWLVGDKLRLRQILVNLVNNAIKFTERGTIHLQTSLDEQSEDTASLRIVITDSGVGIPPERQAVIFESFAQADGSTTRQFGGIGLGLTICKLLVDVMGGQIGFRSEVGEGSSFWVTLTLQKAPRSGDRPDPSAPGSSRLNAAWEAAEGGPKRVQVLVAENDRLQRSTIELLLTRAGSIVVLVGSGREALTVLKHTRCDLAFIGAGMPDMDAPKLIREIRQQKAGAAEPLKIIALTAEGEGPDRRACIEAGADDWLVKSPTPETLFEAVARQIPGFLGATEEATRGAGSESPHDEQAIRHTIAGTVRACTDVLEKTDFDELEGLAGRLRKLASKVRAKSVSDHAMRLRLAARGRNQGRAAEAIAKLQAAVDQLDAGPEQSDPALQSFSQS